MTALVVAGVLVGQPALADDGLSTGSRSRYVLDAKATTVEATMTIDLRNTTPNRGGLYYFFNAFSVTASSSPKITTPGTVSPT